MEMKMEMGDIKNFSVNPIENEMELFKFRLQELLRSNIVEVKFTKVDGTERVMKCTLDPNRIPKEHYPKTEGVFPPENIQRVWDIEKEGWRSFRVDSVHNFMTLRSEA